jgi:peptide/nickel transport system permease protein
MAPLALTEIEEVILPDSPEFLRDDSDDDGRLRRLWRRVSVLGWEGIAGAVILVGLIGCFIFVPLLVHQNPNSFVASPQLPPSWKYPLGTDEYGRNIFLRVCYAGRIDFAIAAIGVTGALCIGTLIGISVTTARRPIYETITMRMVDSIIAFPFVVLVLLFVVIFGTTSGLGPLPRGVPALLAAVFLWDWTIYARLARSRTLELKEAEFITAAHLLGYSRTRILRRHMLPSVLRTAATYAVGDTVAILITTASLPFLGAGVQPPTPEWGQMMFDGQSLLSTAWWITIGPAIVLALSGIGITLLADALIGSRDRRPA